MDPYTGISQYHMKYLEAVRSPREILAFMENTRTFQHRSFRDMISWLRPQYCDKNALANELAKVTGDSISKMRDNAGNWLQGISLPKKREVVFQICFALSLNEREADCLIGFITETGLHYRNPEELIYAYALRKGKTYSEACELKKRMMTRFFSEYDRGTSSCQEVVYSQIIRDDFAFVQSEDALTKFFERHAAMLGTLHETAFREFKAMMQELTRPENMAAYAYPDHPRESVWKDARDALQENAYSIQEIMDTYLRMNVPGKGNVSKLTPLQKMVRRCWPNDTSLRRMLLRKEDVSRKVLILLYLITETYEIDNECDEYACEYGLATPDRTVLFRSRLNTMQRFLEKCGMNPLDPRNEFDYIIIYAIGTQEGEYSSDRLEEVLSLLYPDEAYGK